MNKFFIFCCSILVMACNNNQNAITVTHAISSGDTSNWPAHFGFGRSATADEIAKLDIDVRPDGKGLPVGSGNAITGKTIYMAKCAACHGTGNEPASTQLPAPALFANAIQKENIDSPKTIGNYWPYATTIFDYVRRAMPYNAPGTLSNEEVYHITAFLLYANKIIKEKDIINEKTLPEVHMPAVDRFVYDDRRGGAEIK